MENPLKSLTLTYPLPPAGRIQVLDELRGLAILLVLIYHIGGVTGFPNKMIGEVGVDMFVLLSGAALMLSDRPQEGSLSFLWRRLARLLPAYWIALTIFLLGGIYLLNRTHTPTDIWTHYLGIHPWWGDQYFMSINDSFWFLGLILLLYLFFAVVRRWRERMDILVGVGLIFSFSLVCFTFFYMKQPAVFAQLGVRPPIFFAGLILGELLRKGTVTLPLTGWLGIGLLLTFYGQLVAGTLIGYTVAGFSVFAAYFFSRAHADAAAQRPLCRLLAWLGVYSYEIFLIHQPLIREYNAYAWFKLFDERAPSATQTALGVAVALVITVELSRLLHRAGAWIGRRLAPSTTA